MDNVLLYLNLINRSLNQDNNLVDIKKIYLWFTNIYDNLKLISDENNEQLADMAIVVYQSAISAGKHGRIEKKEMEIIKHECIDIAYALNYKEKVEQAWFNDIFKIIIFDRKDLSLLKTIFFEIPELIPFERNKLLFEKVCDKYLKHLLNCSEKYLYYEKVLIYFLDLKCFSIPKEKKQELSKRLVILKENLKRSSHKKNVIECAYKSIDNVNISLRENKKKGTNLLSVEQLNKKYDIYLKYGYDDEDVDNTSVECEDLREKTVISIDCKGTISIDDAFSIEQSKDGNYILEVYVSDLASRIKMFSQLDEIAFKRGYTIYLPNNHIPMLPVTFGDDEFSLKRGFDKRVLAHRFEFSNSMDLISFKTYRALIRVKRNYTYENVDNILKNETNLNDCKMLKLALELRDKISSLNFYNEDYHKIKKMKRLITSEYSSCEERDNSLGSLIISSFMILTNYFISKKFEELDYPFIYCVNESTSCSDIMLNSDFKNSEKAKKLIKTINESYFPSKYSTINSGHHGLGLDSYCHGTNPIRNYGCLTVQRLEQEFLLSKDVSDNLIYMWEDYINELVDHLNIKREIVRGYSQEYYKLHNKKK